MPARATPGSTFLTHLPAGEAPEAAASSLPPLQLTSAASPRTVVEVSAADRSPNGDGSSRQPGDGGTSSLSSCSSPRSATRGHLGRSGSSGDGRDLMGEGSVKERLKAIEFEIARMRAAHAQSAGNADCDALRRLEKGWNGGVGSFASSPLSSRCLARSTVGGFRPDELLGLTLDGPMKAAAATAREHSRHDDLLGGARYLPAVPTKTRSPRGEARGCSASPRTRQALGEARREALRAVRIKRADAATRIQATWRGRCARAAAVVERQRRLHAQRCTRPAIQIQTAWRATRARRELEVLRQERQAQIRHEQEAIARLLERIAQGATGDDDDDFCFSDDELAIIRAQFERVDTDSSGDVSRDEFATFYNSVVAERLSAEACNRLFDELDADGSGALGFEEFIHLYALIQRREAARRGSNTSAAAQQRVREIDARLRERAALLARWRAEERERKAKYDAERAAEVARLRALFGDAKVDAARRSAAREEFFRRRREEVRRQQAEDAQLVEQARRQAEIVQLVAKARARAERANAAAARRALVAVGSSSPSSFSSSGRGFSGGGSTRGGEGDRRSERGAHHAPAPSSPHSPGATSPKSPRSLRVKGSIGGGSGAEDAFTNEELALLRRQFEFFDVGRSGNITRDEFSLFYNTVAIHTVAAADCDALFRVLDTDNSGTLSFEQFANVYGELQQLEAARCDPLGAQKREEQLLAKIAQKAAAVQREKAMRKKLREDHARHLMAQQRERRERCTEQGLAESEAAEAARRELLQRRHEEARRLREEKERIIAAAREQEDVALFLKKAAYRLKHGLQEEPYAPADVQLLRAQFDRFDVDGSGDITLDEWELFYNAIAVVQVSAAECTAIFRELDTDNSGSLSFDQFVNVYDALQLREAARHDPLSAARYQQLLALATSKSKT